MPYSLSSITLRFNDIRRLKAWSRVQWCPLPADLSNDPQNLYIQLPCSLVARHHARHASKARRASRMTSTEADGAVCGRILAELVS